MDRLDTASARAGEPLSIGVAAAVANAVFQATGQSVHALPVKPAT